MTEAPPLDPQARAFLDELAASEAPPLDSLTPAEARVASEAATPHLCGPPPDVDEVSDRRIQGPGGPLRLRVYRADRETDPRPVVVWLHGGGWVVGSLETYDVLCRRLALASGCVVVSVDYRLAPEHPYPAAVDDALAATSWIRDHAAELGGNGEDMVVAGDSAGGNLAAVVARRVRDIGPTWGAPLAGQVLIYPVTDHRVNWLSFANFGRDHFLTAAGMRWYWDHYVPDPQERHHPDCSPLRAPDLADLAPAVVVVASHDVLHDQGVAYARRLRHAGVRVRLLTAQGQIHGYVRWTALMDAATVAINEIGGRLRALHEDPSSRQGGAP